MAKMVAQICLTITLNIVVFFFLWLVVLLTVKYHFVIINKSGYIGGNVLSILYATR